MSLKGITGNDDDDDDDDDDVPSTAYLTFLTCTVWSMSLVVSYIPTTDLEIQNVYISLMPIPVAGPSKA